MDVKILGELFDGKECVPEIVFDDGFDIIEIIFLVFLCIIVCGREGKDLKGGGERLQ